jgi:anthranilate synthase component 2
MKIILIDNFDSFSYNLVDLLKKEGHAVKVLRNTVSIETLENLIKDQYKEYCLVLSPGPGTPKKAGNLLKIIGEFKSRVPILGICLGHQAIIESMGGTIIKSDEVVHGKSSILNLSKHELFEGMGQSMIIGRYHSLQGGDLPNEIETLAQYENIPMIINIKKNNMIGIQFHPESIMTPLGNTLLNNAIKYLGAQHG